MKCQTSIFFLFDFVKNAYYTEKKTVKLIAVRHIFHYLKYQITLTQDCVDF